MTGVACGVACKIVAQVNAPVPGTETENILTWKIRKVKRVCRDIVPILRHGDDRSRFLTDKVLKQLDAATFRGSNLDGAAPLQEAQAATLDVSARLKEMW